MRKLLIKMQIRRDLSIFLLLLIVFFIIILLYQLHYTNEPSVRIEIPTAHGNEKFESLINEHSSVCNLI
jgi:hypothetical protein